MTVAHQATDRRVGIEAIPKDLRELMTEPQQNTLRDLEGLGWSIEFVRRPLFAEAVLVLVDPTGKKRAVVTEDGSIN